MSLQLCAAGVHSNARSGATVRRTRWSSGGRIGSAKAKGRSDKNGAAGNGRAVHVGSKEDVGGLSPPTDAVYGLAGLYVPASASCDGACIRAPPQPTGRGVARRNRGCGGCGESGVTADA